VAGCSIAIWIVTKLNEALDLHMTLATLFLVGFIAVQASPEGAEGLQIFDSLLGAIGLSSEAYHSSPCTHS
jgi:hypothetical protein